MNYKEFHNLKEIAKKDNEPGDSGIFIHETDHIIDDLNLGKTRIEIHNALIELLPGFDENTINEFTDEAMKQKLEKAQLKNFASLKLESLDASATTAQKTVEEKNNNDDFIEKVETPTIPSPTSNKKTQEASIENDEKETSR